MFMAAFAKPLLCAGRVISAKFNLKTMILLTILNTIAILVIFFKLGIIKATIRRDETFWNKTLMGYDVWVQKVYFRIPIRNKRKTELSEEVHIMIAKYDNQSKFQTLSAKFSWLKTWEQVRQFEKDYSVVDRKIVERLVAGFVPKQ
jgi:hypothetical protein